MVKILVLLLTGLLALIPATSAPAAIEAPVPKSPMAGSLLTQMQADLSWDLPAGADRLELRVTPANNDGPGADLILIKTSSYVLPAPPAWYGLLPDLTYSWQVRGQSAAEWSAWSDAWTFRTPKASPAGITLSSPADGASIDGPLSWNDSNPALWYYEVQVSRDMDFGPSAPLYWELRHGGITDPPRSYTIPTEYPLEPGVTYYWRVRPRIQGDGTPVEWTAASRFTTAGRRRLTLADNGTTIRLQQGDLLELDLESSSYQWSVTVENPKVLELLPTMGPRAMPALFRAAGAGSTTLSATGSLPCHQAKPPCMAPSLFYQVQVQVGPRLVQTLAPIESAQVRKDGEGFVLDVVSGLPNGCVQPGGNSVRREDQVTVRVRVFNLAPADGGVACTLIYGMRSSTIDLGGGFTPGATYRVLVNDRTVTFLGF